ncbi:disease resistance protein At4g27190 [Euphorbia lathyris]|uniref:disease resistance protein At4g27190 n=1 Tax=Euphorbia lathyris TaxID=212925 RepID=UPI0033138D8B
MEALGAAAVEIVKCASIFFYSQISTLANLHRNLKSLQNELEKLNCRKNEIEEDIRLYETEGKYPTAQANGWINKVEELHRQVQPILDEGANVSVNGCNLTTNMHSNFQLSRKALNKCKEVKQLLTDSPHFQNLVAHRKPPVKAVEKEDVPSLAGQKVAEEKLSEIMVQLRNGGIKRIAVYGMGGIGKTTLVKNLNNLLEGPCLMVPFDIVICVAVSRDLDLGRIQSRIAERLSLEFDAGESTEGRAVKLHRTLAGKKFLVILDDVWDKLDLDKVGIPQGNNGKILLTTRNLDVCRAMMTDVDIKMDVLDEEEAWNLFAECAGNVVKLEGIEILARAVARECCGLPLAIKTVGTSMRHKIMIELWQNALCQFKCSAPHVRSIEKEVYVPLKLSFSSLPSKIHQLCFLYCALYPGNFSIKISELIQCWIADDLIDDDQTLEKAYNYGIALVENLKDSCMLEQGEGSSSTVRMHNVLRDVAVWISKERGFFCQAGLSLTQIPCKLQKSYTKISFMNNKITRLPTQLLRCPDLTVLLLQGNPLEKIPDNFFREVTALRVLNLSGTLIKSLPPSLLYLMELRTLLLRDCCHLEKLPPLGDLIELRVLDLCGTRLRDLPWEMGMLSNLRELNLSHTHSLQNIEAGTMSGLANLEALDMSFSAYKWDARHNAGHQKAAFDELLTLEKLSILQIRVDNVECLALDDRWLKRLRKFNIRISPSCDSNYLPIPPDEKRVILRGVDLMTRGLEGLFFNANTLDLVVCGGISNLSEIVARDNLCGLPGLKSLTLSGCDCITSLINGENILRSMFPNLEHLKLSGLRNLAKIMEGMVPKGGCLGKLKTIQVVNCRKLKILISFSLLRQLRKLEEIRVGDCRRIKCLVVAGASPDAVLPKLRVLEMWNMMSLKRVCSRTLQWPALERIEESNCAVLTKLPISQYNVANVKEIKGDIDWWNNIKWDDEEIKCRLQPRFQAHTVLTALRIQNSFCVTRDEETRWEALLKDKVYARIHLEH